MAGGTELRRHCWLNNHPEIERIRKYSAKNEVPAIQCYFDLTEVKQLDNVRVEFRPHLQMVVIRTLRQVKQSEQASRSQLKVQSKEQEEDCGKHPVEPLVQDGSPGGQQDVVDLHLCFFPLSASTVITMEILCGLYEESDRICAQTGKARVMLAFVSDEGGVVYQELSHGLCPLNKEHLSEVS